MEEVLEWPSDDIDCGWFMFRKIIEEAASRHRIELIGGVIIEDRLLVRVKLVDILGRRLSFGMLRKGASDLVPSYRNDDPNLFFERIVYPALRNFAEARDIKREK